MKLISFVIPVYRNEGSLRLTYEAVTQSLKQFEREYDYEFYFVNDGSDDGSLKELLEVRKADDRVKVVDLSRNFGQVQAIVAGFNQAKGDIIFSLSADLQDPIEKIPEMILEFEKGNDIVICNRSDRSDSFKDKLFSSLYYGLMRTSRIKLPEGGFDLFLMSRRALNVLLQIDERNRHLYAEVMWLGFPIKLIPAARKKRTIGKSQYNFWKYLNSLMLSYFNSSYLPIRSMSIIGMFFAFSGFVYAILIVVSYFTNHTPFRGWAPIMILLLIIGGLIMIMLGIIGEYLWRIYDETKKRPYYIIKDKYE